jgi:hypothetical protein
MYSNKLICAGILCLLCVFWGCRGEDGALNPKYEELKYEKESVKIGVEETVTVRITGTPVEARKKSKIEYYASSEGIIDISEKTNDGCVIKGKKVGDTVLVAKADGVTAYLEVKVDGANYVAHPYIVIPTQVVELYEGQRKSVQVSLFGGSPTDNAGFQWSVEQGKGNVAIEHTANTVVIEGLARGTQKVIVEHDRAPYNGEILVFVIGVEEVPVYITTAQNVLLMEAGGPSSQFNVNLINGKETDKNGFTFSVIEGAGLVNIASANETCSVTALRSGSSVIRAAHPLADYPLDVRVIVMSGQDPVIEVDKIFLLMAAGSSDMVTMTIDGTAHASWDNDYEFKLDGKNISGNSVIAVTKLNNVLFIEALRAGSSVITVANKNVEYSREVLVVVMSGVMVPPDEYYITTSQNIMQLEMGQKLPSTLSMQLINGVDADKDGFEWIVDDFTVIDVEPVHGRARSMSQVTSVFNAQALVSPKKVGQSKITVGNPGKTNSTATVIVRVYPRGTFASMPIMLGLKEPAGGMIIVNRDDGAKKVEVYAQSGEQSNIGYLDWKVENTELASVTNSRTVINTVSGHADGMTKLHITGDNLRYPYEGLMLVGSSEYISMQKVIYADQVYQEVVEKQSVNVEIKDSSGMLTSGFTAVSGNPAAVTASMIRNRLLLQGLQASDSAVTVTVEHKDSLNEKLYLYVTVLPETITIDKPYVINAPYAMKGLVYGQKDWPEINMPGASVLEHDKTEWTSGDNSIVKVNGSGSAALVDAQRVRGQANVTIENPRAYNKKTIVYYVVENETELNGVFLGIEKGHYLLKPDDYFMAKLITNIADNDARKAGIRWGGHDPSIVRVDGNGDTAMIRALSAGTTVITVDHTDNVYDSSGNYVSGPVIIPLKIHLSVSNYNYSDKTISLPSIVEVLTGENKQVTADSKGMSASDLAKIRWKSGDSSVVGVSGVPSSDGWCTGEWAYFVGKGEGWTQVSVEQTDINYSKKILAACADTYEGLMNMLVMAAPETYYRVKVGEQRTVQLIYGSGGFPQEEKANIEWKSSNNERVAIFPNEMHDRVTFEARDVGRTEITATHKTKPNVPKVTITVESYRDDMPTDYQWSYPAMLGITLENPVKNVATVITPSGASYAGIIKDTYGMEKPGIANVEQLGTLYEHKITATGLGQAYFRVEHPLVGEPARILVYTATTEAELANMWPVSLAKTNYLIGINKEPIKIKLETANNDAAKINNLSWALDTTGIVDYTINPQDKRELSVVGQKVGNCAFTVKYPGSAGNVVATIYISVTNDSGSGSAIKMTTESIIPLAMGGGAKSTAVTGNLSEDDKRKLQWSSANSLIATAQANTMDRSKATITPIAVGETEVTVTLPLESGSVTRHIKVYVQPTQPGADNYKAVNLDNRYYSLRRGDEMTLSAYHAARAADTADIWEDVYGNNVVSLEPVAGSSNKVQVKGVNEGIATVKLRNADTNGGNPMTDVTFMVEVSNSAPSVAENPDVWYLSAGKTVYALDHEDTITPTQMEVIPMRFTETEIGYIRWSIQAGAHLIQLSPNGKYCAVRPNGQKGTAVVRAEHPRSSNYVDLTVVCGLDLVPSDPSIPFITTDTNTVRMALNGTKEVKATLHNAPGADMSGFSVECDNANVEASMTGDMLFLKAAKHGRSLVTVKHAASNAVAARIIAVVSANENGLIYLTTRDNFVVIQQGDYKAVSVEVVGYDEINQENIKWEILPEGYSDPHSVPQAQRLVSIAQSGTSAVITAGQTKGTARIRVRHIDPQLVEWPVYIYVRITDAIYANPVYLSTANNIVSIREGNSMQLKAELINGSPHELSQIRWASDNTSVAEVVYSGDTAVIRGVKAGQTGVTVTHGSSLNSLSIVIIVESALGDNGLYITTDSLLVEMKSTDAARRLQVRLIGGNAEDIYGFRWEIVDYVSLEKLPSGESRNVANIVGNADVCMVSPEREGYAIVRVSHPKTNYRLEIRVVVQDATGINFARQNIRMDVRTSETVAVTAPTGETVIYYAYPAGIVNASGTSKVCIIEALKPGTAIVTAQNAGGTKSDEIIVIVSDVVANNQKYIEVGTLGSVSNLYMLKNAQGQSLSLQAVVKNASDSSLVVGADAAIEWEVRTPGRVEVLGFAGMVTLRAIGSGDTEIWLTAKSVDGMANYVKKIYVRVEDETISFVVNDGNQYIQLTLGSTPRDFVATVNVPVEYYKANSGGSVEKAIEWLIQDEGERAYLGLEDIGKAGDNRSTCKFIPLMRTSERTVDGVKKEYVTVTCRYGDMERKLTVQIRPMSSVTVNPSVVTVLPWELDGPIASVDISMFPEHDTWTATASTNEFIWFGVSDKESHNIPGTSRYKMRAGGATSGNIHANNDDDTLYISGKNLDGQTEIRITGQESKITASITVNTSRNFYIRFLDKAMVREDLTDPSESVGSGKSYLWDYDIYKRESDQKWLKRPIAGGDESALEDTEISTITNADNGWYQVQFDSTNDDVSVVTATKPDHVNVYVDNTVGNKKMYFGVRSAGGGNVEFESKKGGTTVSMPVYFYYPLIEPQWINIGKGRGFQAVNNGYETGMGIHSYLDMIRGAIVVADGEFIELTVNSLAEKFPFNDFRIIPHTASMFTEMCEGSLRSKVSVRMGSQWNGENVVQIEFNNGRKYGGAPSDLQLGVDYIGTLKVQYAYSNGGPRPQTFERVFLVYAERYKRIDAVNESIEVNK